MTWTGQKIKSLRLKLGWSRAELGRRLGLSLEHCFSLEQGTHSVSAETVEILDQLQAHLSDYSRNLKVKSLCSEHLRSQHKTQATSDEVEEFAKETLLK